VLAVEADISHRVNAVCLPLLGSRLQLHLFVLLQG
jgi:hypothetical protein